ncbi:MAG: ATP-binding cassette domain-containing protein [Synergistaceae bacterium]|jgi:oligopeptide/dipeptide ABC transporter ATP-binding protein|nr:ATP-binding cassette domain-containing protein [Synergistaceae bacterium]
MPENLYENLFEVKNLIKYFKTGKGIVHAVDGVSFTIKPGKTLGIVGESGCGKSTTGRCIIRLIEPTSGEIIYKGRDICKISKAEMTKARKEIQIIFQDPYSSLNPRKTVSQIISEPLLHNRIIDRGDKDKLESRILELMETVGLAERLFNSYPHELDGGRRQRIGIARAISMQPDFIVCDEPVSALDVSIQAQILNLLKRLQTELGLTFIFITHNLSVVNYFADDIAVMYLGQVVEKAPAEELFDNPLHPYTKALLSAILVPETGKKRNRVMLHGEPSSPIDPPAGCRFSKRCNFHVSALCVPRDPPLVEISQNHYVACHCIERQ